MSAADSPHGDDSGEADETTPSNGDQNEQYAVDAEGDAESPPDESDSSPEPLDLTRLFIDDAPMAAHEPSRGLAVALEGVRAAMRERNLLESRSQLQSAVALARTETDNLAIEDLVRVHALWSQGWSQAGRAARDLKSGDVVETWAGTARVESASEREVVLMIDDTPQTLPIRMSEMDVRLATALLTRQAARTGLGLDAHIAAVLVLDRAGTLEASRAACVEAAQRGAYIDPVIGELRRRAWTADESR